MCDSGSEKLTKPIVWTIAGSDSGGGAGIQADLKTFNGLGVYGASVITAITAQNTLGVQKIEGISAGAIKAQIDALREDLPAKAIKTGMLYSTACLKVLGDFLKTTEAYIVCDPVMVATSGDSLIEPDFMETLKTDVLPAVSLLTPNLQEAHRLAGWSLKEFESYKQKEKRAERGEESLVMSGYGAKRVGNLQAGGEEKSDRELDQYISSLARELLALGAKAVLIKGAGANSHFSQDYWTNGRDNAWITSPKLKTGNTHGTGCTLASAIAACVALGYGEKDALVIAKAYVNQGLRNAPGLGQGQGPMAHLGWPETPDDLPWITGSSQDGIERPQFASCGEQPLGFYPIVDSFHWVEKLLPLGVKTMQLRIKNAVDETLEEQVRKAISLGRQYDCRLFINDYWQLAIKHKAYGVHLGSEDLQTADLKAIASGELRLGVSTHCYAEVANALAIRPSYIAIGPIFATTTKTMSSAPQGVEALKRWRRSLRYPLVAIGGISLADVNALREAGADGIAVVRDISEAADLSARVTSWLDAFSL